MVFARSAAMAFNRIADRKIDGENPRTEGRHIPAGKLSLRSVVVFTVIMSLGFVLSTLCFWPNWLPLALSIPVLMVLFAYSLTKRFTSLAHYWLGLSLMLAPIAAWIAIRGEQVLIDPLDLLPPTLLGGVVFFWVAGFDIIYACQDFEFDKQARLKSIPVRFGVAGALRIAAVSHFVMIGILACLPFVDQLGGPALGLGNHLLDRRWRTGGIAALRTLVSNSPGLDSGEHRIFQRKCGGQHRTVCRRFNRSAGLITRSVVRAQGSP